MMIPEIEMDRCCLIFTKKWDSTIWLWISTGIIRSGGDVPKGNFFDSLLHYTLKISLFGAILFAMHKLITLKRYQEEKCIAKWLNLGFWRRRYC